VRPPPVVSVVAAQSLALGIGANTAIFSLFNSLMLRSLPVSDPQRLVVVNDSTTTSGNNSWTFAIWDNIRQRAQAFDGTLAWSAQRFSLAQAGETQFVDGMYVSRDYFTTLGVPVLIGRTITADDDARGGGKDGPVAVISYAFWQRQYGGAADVLGRTLTIESVPFTIIGVTPPEFFGTEVGRAFDVAIPPQRRTVDPWQGNVARSARHVVAQRDVTAEAQTVA
jgi:putative ABC transport system permease protein